MLIAVEGIDGAGKSTQIPWMADLLRSNGHEVVITAEPTHGQFGRQIREAPSRLSPQIERKLFVDDRREHLETFILPNLSQGKTVITDRYFYSSIAYQGSRRDALVPGMTLEKLQEEIGIENRSFAPEADILVLFRLDVDISIQRMQSGRKSLDPFEARQTLIDVAEAFESIARKHPRALIIDAGYPIPSVRLQIQNGLSSLLGWNS